MKLWQKWRQTTVANKLLVWTGAIVAVGTLGQVGIAVFNYCLMVRSATETATQINKIIVAANNIAQNIDNGLSTTLGEMKDQTKAMQDAAAASLKNAGAATNSAKVAEHALKVSQRAYLSVGNWSITLNPDSIPEIKYSILNTEHTPATLIEQREGYWVDTKLPENPELLQTHARVKSSPPIPGGQSVGNRTQMSDFDTFKYQSIQSGQARPWFYVRCTYSDYFREKHRFGAVVVYETDSKKLVIDTKSDGYNHGD